MSQEQQSAYQKAYDVEEDSGTPKRDEHAEAVAESCTTCVSEIDDVLAENTKPEMTEDEAEQRVDTLLYLRSMVRHEYHNKRITRDEYFRQYDEYTKELNQIFDKFPWLEACTC